MVKRIGIVVAALVLLAAAAQAGDAAAAFPGFCDHWMQLLRTREHDNISHIKWQQSADGIEGDYIGYPQEHTCVMKSGTGDVPVGKISYREVHYAKHGKTVAEAQQSAAQPLDTTQVTEIFSYSHGHWSY